MSVELRDRLISTLLRYGETGIKQAKLTGLLQRYGDSNTLRAELEDLRRENKVQRFTVPNAQARPITMWRATTEILK